MSSLSLHTFTCPRCMFHQQVEIYESINPTVDPELRVHLLNDGINWFVCQSCRFADRITTSLLYHDMERKIYAQYLPFSYLNDEGFLQRFSLDGQDNAELDAISGMSAKLGIDLLSISQGMYARKHLVFDMDELRRYILFRERVINAYAMHSPEQ